MANTRDTMGEQATLDALVAGTITNFEESGCTKVAAYALYGTSLVSVVLPNVTEVVEYGLYNCEDLTSFDAPLLSKVGSRAFNNAALLNDIDLSSVTDAQTYAFSGCKSLESADISSLSSIRSSIFTACLQLRSVVLGDVTSIGSNAFLECYSLSSINLDAIESIGSNSFKRCYSLNNVDLSSVTTVNPSAFYDSGIGELVLPECSTTAANMCNGPRTSVIDLAKVAALGNTAASAYSLYHLILRNQAKVTVSSIAQTPLSNGVGWIYVPSDLVDTYKADENWSAYASQIVALSEYPKALQDEDISDDWATINANPNYSTDYNIGDVKYVNIGGTRYAMELVAFDSDELASGGTARMTWIGRGILSSFLMGFTDRNTEGWLSCSMRSWLRNVIYPQIESEARNAIKEVTKTYHCYSNPTTRSTTDTIWVPSSRELGFSSSTESSGAVYTDFFTSNDTRKKVLGGAGQTFESWATRSSNSNTSFMNVGNTGTLSASSSPNTRGVVLGFCI